MPCNIVTLTVVEEGILLPMEVKLPLVYGLAGITAVPIAVKGLPGPGPGPNSRLSAPLLQHSRLSTHVGERQDSCKQTQGGHH